MTDYLVTELGPDVHSYTCVAHLTGSGVHVEADGPVEPVEAARVAMGVFGRPGRYAVVACEVVDLTVPDGVDGGLLEQVAGQGPR